MARSCFNCRSLDEREPEGDEPGSGVASFCVIYQEWIDSEAHAAADCPVYDPVRGPHAAGGPRTEAMGA